MGDIGFLVSVTQAVMAIPSAIKDLTDLLRGVKSQKGEEEALAHLRSLRDHISTFCEAHKWLREAKEHHDLLTYCDSSLEEPSMLIADARSHGAFNPHVFDIPTARRSWVRVRNDALERIFALARNVKYIDQPLKVTAQGDFESGPDWAHKFIEQRTKIEDLFRRYDAHDLTVQLEIATELEVLISFTKQEMIRANSMIKAGAGEIADKLSQLQGALSHV